MKLVVCPASGLEAALHAHRPQAAISLISPDAVLPDLPFGESRRLVLRFNDITEPREGLVAPHADLIHRLLAFEADLPQEATLLLHCYAGISRSPAAAYILACARSGPGQEETLSQGLRALSPECTPNSLMVRLADDILQRGGEMVRAVEAIGRGAEAFEGSTVTLYLAP